MKYVATITYTTGTRDTKIVKAKSLSDAWEKIVKAELTGKSVVCIQKIELVPVLCEV